MEIAVNLQLIITLELKKFDMKHILYGDNDYEKDTKIINKIAKV